LTVSLDQPGTYLYALEEITDGVGNTIRVGIEAEAPATDSLTKTKTTRSFMVLQKPAVSFSHCSHDTHVSLLIGSESSIKIKSVQVDAFDLPLNLDLKYQPPTEDPKGGKKLKPWKKALKLHGDDKSLTLRVNTPGEYKITGVKGKVDTFISGSHVSELMVFSAIVLYWDRFGT
jgi:nucleoporin POM152